MKNKTKEIKCYGDGTKGMKNFFSLLRYYKPYKFLLLAFFVVMIISTVVAISFPIFSARIIASISSSELVNVLIFAAASCGAHILRRIFDFISFDFIACKLITNVVIDLKKDVSQKTLLLKTKNFDNAKTGFFINTCNGATKSYARAITNLTSNLLTLISQIFYIGFASVVNIWLGVYVVISIVITFILHYLVTRYQTKKRKITIEMHDDAVSFSNESIRGIRDLKYSKLQDEVINKGMQKLSDAESFSYKVGKKTGLFYALTDMAEDIFLFGYIALIVLMMFKYNLSPVVALTVFSFYSYASNFAYTVSHIVEIVKKTEVDAYRINQILSGYMFGFDEFGNELVSPSAKKEIEFKKVNFAYNDEAVLKNMNFKIKENSTIGIVGESGVGKSTMIKLIAKMYDVTSGQILVAGKDINSLSQDALRTFITIVPQEPYIFNMSIRENMLLANSSASDDDIISALKKAQLYDFVSQQKDGLDTILGENGIILSGGQKQRLAIARALTMDTPILILDEATSSLDNENQEKIKSVLHNLSGSRTIIIIAHRLSTIIDCDEILFIKNGKVFKKGTHQQLISKCKEYQSLYSKEIQK